MATRIDRNSVDICLVSPQRLDEGGVQRISHVIAIVGANIDSEDATVVTDEAVEFVGAVDGLSQYGIGAIAQGVVGMAQLLHAALGFNGVDEGV